MPDAAEIIRDNLQRVRERIANAAAVAGRSPDEITLVGVSKYVDAEKTALLAAAGCLDLGESRPQQLWAKADSSELASYDVRWHMIGHLQSNKIKRTMQLHPLLHGIDSYRTLGGLNKVAEQGDFVAEVLLEVNCSGDPEKDGIAPEQLPAGIEDLDAFRHVRVCGLMTMAARVGGVDVARRNFARLRELRDQVAPLAPAGTTLETLSMGMSGDFEAAIAEGSTMVRVGSALWENLP